MALGEVSVKAFQEVGKEGVRVGLELKRDNNVALDVYFPNDSLLDHWLSLLEPYCHLRSFPDDYRILYKLGSGRFGTVSAALEYTTGVTYAVKMVSMDRRMMLENELRVLQTLKVEGVPTAKRIYEHQHAAYLVMQLAPGMDIQTYLSRFGAFSEYLSRKVIFLLTRLVNAVHKQGIIHRDIKPENVLIDTRRRTEVSSVWLVDFGLGIRRDQAKAGSCSGTAGYLAPELLQLQSFDSKADIFSLGALTYTLLAGESPFASSSVQRVAYLNSKCRLRFTGAKWRNVSTDCIAFITKVTAVDPNERPTAEEALNLPWLQSLQQQYEELSLRKASHEKSGDSIASTVTDS